LGGNLEGRKKGWLMRKEGGGKEGCVVILKRAALLND
jgi:hypothetical protein